MFAPLLSGPGVPDLSAPVASDRSGAGIYTVVVGGDTRRAAAARAC